jgi:hypothetical protein
MKKRLKEEIERLREYWPDLTYREGDRWVLLPRYGTPDTCEQDTVSVCFQIPVGHPGAAPYGFYVQQPITRVGGGGFNNTTTTNEPPFDGQWLKFSWRPADWRPASNIRSGANLTDWALTFRERLAQGK